MKTDIILPLELWDKILRYHPLFPLYFVSTSFLVLLDNRYTHLKDWIQESQGSYISDMWINTHNDARYTICKKVDKFGYQSVTFNDPFSALQLRYVSNPEGNYKNIRDIIIRNKNFYIKLVFELKNDTTIISTIDSNMYLEPDHKSLLLTNCDRYFRWITNLSLESEFNLSLLLGDIYSLME